jgi:hypothetical protein
MAAPEPAGEPGSHLPGGSAGDPQDSSSEMSTARAECVMAPIDT